MFKKVLITFNLLFFSIVSWAESSQEKECKKFIESLPQEYVTGHVFVPEDWSNSSKDAKKIKVFYFYRQNKWQNINGDIPVVFFNGGPGGTSHRIYKKFDEKDDFNKLTMIYIDQRGTGCSSPFPEGFTKEVAQKSLLYGTMNIVKDAEFIRHNIFDGKKWRVFGQSYGGHIVRRYIIEHPEGIDGAYVHGMALVSDPLMRLIKRNHAQYENSKEYFKRYPQDKINLMKAKSLIPPDKCFTKGLRTICGNAVLDSLGSYMGFVDAWPSLHERFLSRLITKDQKLDVSVMKFIIDKLVFRHNDQYFFVTSAIIMQETFPHLRTETACPKVLKTFQDQGIDLDEIPFLECRLYYSMKSSWQDSIKSLKVGKLVTFEDLKISLENYPELRLYVYAGAKDVFSPLEVFTEEKKYLDDLYTFKVFENSGHEGYYTEQEVALDLNAIF